jgi:uncharacterized protein
MLAFQQFQHQLATHLRDPAHAPRPRGVPARRLQVYSELLFNNVSGFLNSCFPVCQAVLGPTRWSRLCRTFYRDWPSHTPWFREIPREFVRYLQEAPIAQPLPRWFADLAHYEWAELAVDVMSVDVPAHDPKGDLMAHPVCLNPARINIASPWPVHRIGPAHRPRVPQPTFVVVYRNAQHQSRFTVLNAITAQLLNHLDQGLTGQASVSQIALALGHHNPKDLNAVGQALLQSLREQGLILGVKT